MRFGLIHGRGARYRPAMDGDWLLEPFDSIPWLLAESELNTQTRPEAFRLRAGNFNLLVLRLLDHSGGGGAAARSATSSARRPASCASPPS